MSEALVRFEPAQEIIMEKLLSLGIYKTKSEIIRASILELGKEYGVFKSVQDLEDALVVRKMQKISDEIDSGKRKLVSFEEVLKEHGLKKSDLK